MARSAQTSAPPGTPRQLRASATARLLPESGQDSYIRFIETADPGGYGPPMTFGWNAMELLVRDVDALAAALSRFAIHAFWAVPVTSIRGRGRPRAMQVVGPSGELVYFTRILPGGSRYGLHGARSPSTGSSSSTVGGPSSEQMHAFYGGTLGHRIMDRMPFINTILADGCARAALHRVPDLDRPDSRPKLPGGDG